MKAFTARVEVNPLIIFKSNNKTTKKTETDETLSALATLSSTKPFFKRIKIMSHPTAKKMNLIRF